MSTIAQIILEILQIAPSVPGLIVQIEQLYTALVTVLSASDSSAIASALADAKAKDAAATAAADTALSS